MSVSPIYGLQCTRITLYADDAVTPTHRVTLQKETREGLELSFKAEGVLHQLGSGAGWARVFTPRGWRPSLAIKWDVAMESIIEDRAGSAWGAARIVSTAEALSLVEDRAMRVPCRVSPHKDVNLDFLAQPDPATPFRLKDRKGVVHTGLELDLIAKVVMSGLPSWDTLNDYFAQGAVTPGFVEFRP